MTDAIRCYSNSKLVHAIRFTGANADEIINFGTEPAGSHPRVWRSPWLDDHNDPIDGLAFVNEGPNFYQLRAGDWLIREHDGVLSSCDEATFRRSYTPVTDSFTSAPGT